MPFERVIAKFAMRARFAAPFLCLVILAGCDSQPSETRVPDEVVASLVTPLCHEGFCNGDTDPYPNEPGIWISSSVTSETCGGGGSNDTDQDGLRDLCENNLASYFAPLLRYSTNDNTNGEPRWAARRFWVGSELHVLLLYLPSYYVDLGTNHTLCSAAGGLCAGHSGDSEAIALEIYFNEITQHWVLHKASYSVHTGYGTYVRTGGSQYPTSLSYDGKVGGRPQVFVAFGKHANYASQAQCDGGQMGFDNCLPNASRVLATGAQRNLGSITVKQIDCVYSSNPLYVGLGRQECYWQDIDFSGWIGTEPDSDPHRDRLIAFGFVP